MAKYFTVEMQAFSFLEIAFLALYHTHHTVVLKAAFFNQACFWVGGVRPDHGERGLCEQEAREDRHAAAIIRTRSLRRIQACC